MSHDERDHVLTNISDRWPSRGASAILPPPYGKVPPGKTVKVTADEALRFRSNLLSCTFAPKGSKVPVERTREQLEELAAAAESGKPVVAEEAFETLSAAKKRIAKALDTDTAKQYEALVKEGRIVGAEKVGSSGYRVPTRSTDQYILLMGGELEEVEHEGDEDE